MISTRNLSRLPDLRTLRRLTQSLAVLDAVLSPEWELRYHSFDSRWGEGEMLASLRNGSGDGWFLRFCPAGAILKGFAHESPMSGAAPWPGVLSEVPTDFADFLAEPAFSPDQATFCVWRTVHDPAWRRGPVSLPTDNPDPDGSERLLRTLDGDPRTYQQWAEDYYETAVPRAAIEAIYQHRPLTDALIARLNPELSVADIADDLAEIGYPS